MEKVSPPVRIFAILLVVLGMAGMLAMRTLGPTVATESSTAPVQLLKRAKPAAAPKPAAQAKPAAAKPAAAKSAAAKKKSAAPARAAASAPKAVNPPQEPSGLPVAIDRALGKHELVVVSLVLPGARVDELAAAEAREGARLSGAGYLALNVLNEDVARALLTKLGTLEDPSLLVVKRGGEVVLQLNGFVDRATVAQAAANASALTPSPRPASASSSSATPVRTGARWQCSVRSTAATRASSRPRSFRSAARARTRCAPARTPSRAPAPQPSS
jgi:hypothetical protein